MKRILLTLVTMTLVLTACGQNSKKEMKTLVAYFSATGTTEAVAKDLAEVTGATPMKSSRKSSTPPPIWTGETKNPAAALR